MTYNFLLVLPFVASAMYGLCYIVLEKIVGIHISPPTFLCINAVANLFAILYLVYGHGDKIDFKPALQSWPVLTMAVVAAGAPVIGWVFTIYSIKNTSALYTAFAETSYPFFTLVFGFLIFGMRQMNFTTFCGGLLIFAGAVVMVYGKNQIGPNG